LKYFNQAKKLKPQSISLTIWLGKRGYTNDAYSLMNEQLAKDLDNTEYISNAVMISMDKGEKDSAIRYLEKLKRLSPSNLDVKRYEGYFAEEEDKQNEAIAFWQEVLKGDPKDMYIIGKLNSIYHKRMDY
jgi:tetratricopeptide (TPR) repeat protein